MCILCRFLLGGDDPREVAGRGSVSVSGGAQQRRAQFRGELCARVGEPQIPRPGWKHGGASSTALGSVPVPPSAGHMGGVGCPLLVPRCWPGVGRTAARSTPAPHPGFPGGLAARTAWLGAAPRARASLRAECLAARTLGTCRSGEAGPQACEHCDPLGDGRRELCSIWATAL